MKKNYKMKIHKAREGGYWAEFPELPGCFTQGETLKELRKMAKEAVSCYLMAERNRKR